ncbi:hypothetical protein RND81_06G208500 [Saponaria officinalis]|uniref:Late embryogenesis abundant protein LEA-2 subgroup domain-containing protein n=1 Tax=Saponaria officinalis TaxID=3572 RepID=A0AAW1KE62_SAPOF
MPTVYGSERRTHPLIWCVAIICTFLTIIVIFTGLVVFIGYLVIRPRVPYVIVTNAHLDMFDTSQAGLLSIQITLWMKAENGNHDAQASFSDFEYDLSFHGIRIDTLKNWDFDVGKNSSILYKFEAKSMSIPLDPEQEVMVSQSINQNRIVFHLLGHTRARWRVGPLKSVKFWCNLFCELQFHMDGTSFESHCTPKFK